MAKLNTQIIKLFILILLISITACSGRNSNNKYNSKFGNIDKDGILDLSGEEIKFIKTPLHKITIPAQSKLSNIPNQYHYDWSTVIDTIIVVPLDNKSKEGMIMSSDKIVIKDSVVYILDKDRAKKIYAFNRNTGKFIRTIGDAGRAVNEYVAPHDFFIINDSLCGIYDHFGRKILYFERDGSYLRTTKLKYIAMNMVNNSGDTTLWCVGHGNYHLPEIGKFDLMKIGLSGKIVNGLSHGNSYLNFSSLYNLKPYENGIVYHHPFSNNLLHVKDSLSYNFVEVKFEENGLPDDFVAQCKGDMENFFELYQQTHSFVDDFILTDEYIIIRYTSQPRLPYILIYSIKENRIIAQGLNGVEVGANIEAKLENHLLGSINTIASEGNTIWRLIDPVSLANVKDDEGFRKYNIDKAKLMDENQFLVMIKMK